MVDNKVYSEELNEAIYNADNHLMSMRYKLQVALTGIFNCKTFLSLKECGLTINGMEQMQEWFYKYIDDYNCAYIDYKDAQKACLELFEGMPEDVSCIFPNEFSNAKRTISEIIFSIVGGIKR